MYIRINDASNTFEKAYISSAMEYSSNNGETWTTYNEANPPQFPGDLTILLRESASNIRNILPAGPAKSFTFTSNVYVVTGKNSLSTSLSTLEYSRNGGEWVALNVDQVVPMQSGDVVQIREVARDPFPAGTPTSYDY